MKQETLEEAAKNYADNGNWEMFEEDRHIIRTDAFIEGAKWQQERMYSEEDVKNMLIDMSSYINTKELKDDSDTNFNEWVRKRDWFMSYLFEQFKKEDK